MRCNEGKHALGVNAAVCGNQYLHAVSPVQFQANAQVESISKPRKEAHAPEACHAPWAAFAAATFVGFQGWVTVALQLLPDIGNEHATKQVVLGAFAAGSPFMYALQLWTERTEAHTSGAAKCAAVGLLVATFVDVATDALVIRRRIRDRWKNRHGTGARPVGGTAFLGLAITSERIAGWRMVGATAALGLTVLGFAVLANLVLAGASAAVLAGVLSFSAAALLRKVLCHWSMASLR